VATTLAASAPLAQAQEQKGPTLGGHIGFVLPLVTHSGGQTTSLADAPAVAFPVGITVRGSGGTAFDLEFVPQYKATGSRLAPLASHSQERHVVRRACLVWVFHWVARAQLATHLVAVCQQRQDAIARDVVGGARDKHQI
jgi:hypothetical protein